MTFANDPEFSAEESASILAQVISIGGAAQCLDYLGSYVFKDPSRTLTVEPIVQSILGDIKVQWRGVCFLLDWNPAKRTRETNIEEGKKWVTGGDYGKEAVAIDQPLEADPTNGTLKNASRSIHLALDEREKFDDSLEFLEPRPLWSRNLPESTRLFSPTVGPHGLWAHFIEGMYKTGSQTVEAMSYAWEAAAINASAEKPADMALFSERLGPDFTEHAAINLRQFALALGVMVDAVTEKNRAHINSMAPNVPDMSERQRWEFKRATWALYLLLNEKHQDGDIVKDSNGVKPPRGGPYNATRMTAALGSMTRLFSQGASPEALDRLGKAVVATGESWLAFDLAGMNGLMFFNFPMSRRPAPTPPDPDPPAKTLAQRVDRLESFHTEEGDPK